MANQPSSCPNLKMANMFSFTNLKNSQQVHFSVKSLATSQKVPHTCLIVFVFKLTWSAVNIYNMFKLFVLFLFQIQVWRLITVLVVLQLYVIRRAIRRDISNLLVYKILMENETIKLFLFPVYAGIYPEYFIFPSNQDASALASVNISKII